MLDVVCGFIRKGDGEIHHWWAWLLCAGGGSWRPLFLLAAEPHGDRWIHLRLRSNEARVPDMFLSSELLIRGAYVMALCCSSYVRILIRPARSDMSLAVCGLKSKCDSLLNSQHVLVSSWFPVITVGFQLLFCISMAEPHLHHQQFIWNWKLKNFFCGTPRKVFEEFKK